MNNQVPPGARIFLVEDELAVAMLIEDMLLELGCEIVGIAAKVSKALDAIRSDAKIDAAILDVNLDGEKSYPIADELTERGIPYLFSTGYGLAGIDPRYRDRATVLHKPFSQEDLERAVTLLFKSTSI